MQHKIEEKNNIMVQLNFPLTAQYTREIMKIGLAN